MDLVGRIDTERGGELARPVVQPGETLAVMVGEKQIQIAVIVEVDEREPAHPPICRLAITQSLHAAFGRDDRERGRARDGSPHARQNDWNRSDESRTRHPSIIRGRLPIRSEFGPSSARFTTP
jgi:hypothetical protein